MPKKINQPTEHDLEVWRNVNQDLMDWLYSGLTGKFQLRGHQVVGRWSKKFTEKRVIEIGCGHGHHLLYGEQNYKNYIGLDIEYKYAATVQSRYENAAVVNGDAYQLPFADNSTDAVLSIYNLQHLKKLDTGLKEIYRILKPEGELLIGLPAEGGFAYDLGRDLTSKPYMEKKYGIDYDTVVHYEHCNTFKDIVRNLEKDYEIINRRYIPFPFLPSVHCNVIVCLRAKKKVNKEKL